MRRLWVRQFILFLVIESLFLGPLHASTTPPCLAPLLEEQTTSAEVFDPSESLFQLFPDLQQKSPRLAKAVAIQMRRRKNDAPTFTKNFASQMVQNIASTPVGEAPIRYSYCERTGDYISYLVENTGTELIVTIKNLESARVAFGKPLKQIDPIFSWVVEGVFQGAAWAAVKNPSLEKVEIRGASFRNKALRKMLKKVSFKSIARKVNPDYPLLCTVLITAGVCMMPLDAIMVYFLLKSSDWSSAVAHSISVGAITGSVGMIPIRLLSIINNDLGIEFSINPEYANRIALLNALAINPGLEQKP